MTVTEDVAHGPVRINLIFNERPVRVPYGVTLFDAASWNGIAIDSTCGGHGTCKKCRIRIAADPPAPSSLDIRAYTKAELADGWRLACRTPATRDTVVEVPPLTTRPKAATVGVGRQVILRPAVQKRYLELAEPTLADQATDLERVLAKLDDLADLFDVFRSVLVGGLRRFLLNGDVELDGGSIGGGFEFAVSADVDGVGKSSEGGVVLRECGDGERENDERGFHELLLKEAHRNGSIVGHVHGQAQSWEWLRDAKSQYRENVTRRNSCGEWGG